MLEIEINNDPKFAETCKSNLSRMMYLLTDRYGMGYFEIRIKGNVYYTLVSNLTKIEVFLIEDCIHVILGEEYFSFDSPDEAFSFITDLH